MRHLGKLSLLIVLLVVFAFTTRQSDAHTMAAAPTGTVSSTPTSEYGIPTNPDPSSRAPDSPPVVPGVAQGSPAIIPSRPNAAIGLPTFTAEDVKAQIMRAGGWQSTFRVTGPVTVEGVEFLTGKQVKERLNRSISQPDDSLLCFVTLTGSFARSGVDASTQVQSTTIRLIFNARSGNLVGMTGK